MGFGVTKRNEQVEINVGVGKRRGDYCVGALVVGAMKWSLVGVEGRWGVNAGAAKKGRN